MAIRTIYVSGPMTGIANKNFPAFIKATKALRQKGYKVVSPAELEGLIVRLSWEGCMRRDIEAQMKCDGVAVLPGWKKSRGANLEVHIAKTLSMPVHPVNYWLKRRKR